MTPSLLLLHVGAFLVPVSVESKIRMECRNIYNPRGKKRKCHVLRLNGDPKEGGPPPPRPNRESHRISPLAARSFPTSLFSFKTSPSSRRPPQAPLLFLETPIDPSSFHQISTQHLLHQSGVSRISLHIHLLLSISPSPPAVVLSFDICFLTSLVTYTTTPGKTTPHLPTWLAIAWRALQ